MHLGCVYRNFTYLGDPVEHCTPGVRLRNRSRQFTTPYTALCSKLNFRTHAVRICIVRRSSTRTVHLGCVYIDFTYRTAIYTRSTTRRPHPAVKNTVDSHLQQMVFSYTFCTELYSSPKHNPNSALRLCVLRLCVHKLYLPGRSRSAPYTRCTTPRQHMAFQHTIHSKRQQTEFSYTCCTDPYSSSK